MNDEKSIWDAYNLLLLGPDIERIRKLLARYELFRMTLDLPGDIVECGVLKGTSYMMFLKMLHICAPGSNKRVIGFDMFESFPIANEEERGEIEDFVNESGFQGTSISSIYERIEKAGLARSRCELVAGEIAETVPAYVARNPGLRLSLLHLDLDVESPTYTALEAFWPRLVPGGVVILDEYAVARWTESDAVDRYFKGQPLRLRTITWARTPTAYIVKEDAL